jgi:hypothetical protein
VAVLTDGDGNIPGTVQSRARLSVAEVEELCATWSMRASRRRNAARRGPRAAERGDVDSAFALYEKVAEARCLALSGESAQSPPPPRA